MTRLSLLFILGCTRTIMVDTNIPTDLMKTCYIEELPPPKVPRPVGWPEPAGTMISKTDGEILTAYLQNYLEQLDTWAAKVRKCLQTPAPK